MIILETRRKRSGAVIAALIKRKKEGKSHMSEIIKSFIGKQCMVKIMGEIEIGTLASIEDNWLVLENDSISKWKSSHKIINLEHISCISEWPNKKKKKEEKNDLH